MREGRARKSYSLLWYAGSAERMTSKTNLQLLPWKRVFCSNVKGDSWIFLSCSLFLFVCNRKMISSQQLIHPASLCIHHTYSETWASRQRHISLRATEREKRALKRKEEKANADEIETLSFLMSEKWLDYWYSLLVAMSRWRSNIENNRSPVWVWRRTGKSEWVKESSLRLDESEWVVNSSRIASLVSLTLFESSQKHCFWFDWCQN